MSFYERFKLLCDEADKTPTGVGREVGADGSTVNYWKNNHTPKHETLSKIAAYFNVSVDYLLEKTDIRTPANNQDPEEIAKVALFGGDQKVTDEMWAEVKQFVEFVKQKHLKD